MVDAFRARHALDNVEFEFVSFVTMALTSAAAIRERAFAAMPAASEARN